MLHYILSFTVYTLAMSGLIGLALLVYKKVQGGVVSGKNSKILSIEESMALNPRKSLMIVKAGSERFLIACDLDKTTLIAKLNQQEMIVDAIKENVVTTYNHSLPKSTIVDLDKVKNTIDNENMNVLFPNKNKKEKDNNKNLLNNKFQNKTESKEPKNVVHFEVINDKNPQGAELRKSRNGKRQNVTIEVGKVRNHGLSTIKEIVHKVNEI